MLADAVVVDHVADILARRRAVHACDRLQQLRFLDCAVQIEDLFNRSVEAGQQHRLHDQERNRRYASRFDRRIRPLAAA